MHSISLHSLAHSQTLRSGLCMSGNAACGQVRSPAHRTWLMPHIRPGSNHLQYNIQAFPVPASPSQRRERHGVHAASQRRIYQNHSERKCSASYPCGERSGHCVSFATSGILRSTYPCASTHLSCIKPSLFRLRLPSEEQGRLYRVSHSTAFPSKPHIRHGAPGERAPSASLPPHPLQPSHKSLKNKKRLPS